MFNVRNRYSEKMTLPFRRPLPPMEALPVDKLPRGPHWQYEPKWDGFRCIAFRDHSVVDLQSKSGRSLTRYFPELVDAIVTLEPRRLVLDGEVVVPQGSGFSFDQLLQRIHPASSRIRRLASETPATLIVFDLLFIDGRPFDKKRLEIRRAKLEQFASKYLRGHKRFWLSPTTTKISSAKKWLKKVSSATDGVIAKRLDLPYQSNNRFGMQKIKNFRTADCVIGGFRYGHGKKIVGSLLLGLYDEQGLLNHVGFTSALKSDEKKRLTARLQRLIGGPGFTGAKPGGPSRWSTKRSSLWTPIRPRLVVEVSYDHFSGGRFRHGTTLVRWRSDKSPRQCTISQIERPGR